MGNGAGDAGYGFGLEISDLRFDRAGRLAYARTADPNSNSSQFFITDAPTPHLSGQYTIFGQCENLDVVKKIANAPKGANDRPLNPTKINHITIVKPGESTPSAAKPAKPGGK
jgi:peptidyl-prolyl cis-trans isomerase A (cyclophilin A)